MKKGNIELIMTIILIAAAILLSQNTTYLVSNSKTEVKNPRIVIDAGHGGNDPGKIGVSGEKEKDINLAIAKKLEKLLKKADVEVIMTRNKDVGLYNPNSSNKKVDDMRKRCQLIDESEAHFTVSIHQNSYHQGAIRGSQVFYYEHSDEGERIAKLLQTKLVSKLDKKNKRKAKANDSYYLLRKTKNPTIIVECGFLSNPEEAKLLSDEDYQNQIARAICEGILEFFQ